LASQRVSKVTRQSLWRAFAAILISALVLAPGISAAAAVPRAYAGIVVDAKSGKTLYESNADAYRYPASVTKVMTLYILFQELSAGNVKLSDKMTVSKHAASAVPTKLGLKAGSTITVENAIKSLVTLSANDMARAIAEYVGGSESAFAKRMTSTAKALGMQHTTYANASGLPDSRQITTVRDQAILAQAIYEHFPKYYEFFQTSSFTYGKRTYRNHNNLLGKNGVDGIKTGYINAAGYNLMTAARSDGRHLVVIGFGFDRAATRDAKVRELVQKYLPKARSGGYLQVASIPKPGVKASPTAKAAVQVASIPVPMPMPTFREASAALLIEAPANPEIGIGDVDETVTAAELAPVPAPMPMGFDTTPAVAAVEQAAPSAQGRPTLDQVIGAFTNAYLGAPPAPLGLTRPSAPIVPPVGIGDDGAPIDLMTSGSVQQVAETVPAASQAMPAALPHGWVVQIGAAPSEGGANSLLSDAAGKVRTLGDYAPFIERFDKDGQTFFRARFGGFAGQGAAADMCKQLKEAKMSCLAMQS